MFHRDINISKSQSFFLCGTRGMGKSTLLEQVFKPDECVVLDFELANELISYPSQLLNRLAPHQNKITLGDH